MLRSIKDGICVCGGGGDGGDVDGSNGGGGADGSGENSVVGDGGESGVYRSGGSVVHRSVGGGCVEVVDILMLDAVFVVEGVVLVVGCVMRLVLCCFCWKPVEMNGQSIGGFLFGIVIWVDHFIFLEWGFLDKMVGADMLLDVVVVEVVVVGTVDVMQVCFFVFFRRGCLWDMMGNSGDRGCG